MCAQSLSCVWLFVTPWTVACQALLSMQEYWKKRKWTLLKNTGEIAISYSRGSSQPMDQTCVSCIFWVGRWIPYHCVPWEARCYFIVLFFIKNIYKGIFYHWSLYETAINIILLNGHYNNWNWPTMEMIIAWSIKFLDLDRISKNK